MKAEGLDLCTTKGLSERLLSSYVLHSVGPNWQTGKAENLQC